MENTDVSIDTFIAKLIFDMLILIFNYFLNFNIKILIFLTNVHYAFLSLLNIVIIISLQVDVCIINCTLKHHRMTDIGDLRKGKTYCRSSVTVMNG